MKSQGNIKFHAIVHFGQPFSALRCHSSIRSSACTLDDPTGSKTPILPREEGRNTRNEVHGNVEE